MNSQKCVAQSQLSLPSSFQNFMARNRVHLCALGYHCGRPSSSPNNTTTELKLSLLTQHSHSSKYSPHDLRKVHILQKKNYIRFEIPCTLWLGSTPGIKARLPQNPNAMSNTEFITTTYLLCLNREVC